jgi:hypothetical protein
MLCVTNIIKPRRQGCLFLVDGSDGENDGMRSAHKVSDSSSGYTSILRTVPLSAGWSVTIRCANPLRIYLNLPRTSLVEAIVGSSVQCGDATGKFPQLAPASAFSPIADFQTRSLILMVTLRKQWIGVRLHSSNTNERGTSARGLEWIVGRFSRGSRNN